MDFAQALTIEEMFHRSEYGVFCKFYSPCAILYDYAAMARPWCSEASRAINRRTRRRRSAEGAKEATAAVEVEMTLKRQCVQRTERVKTQEFFSFDGLAFQRWNIGAVGNQKRSRRDEATEGDPSER